MRKVTVPNFCINFLNKAEKSLPILYDFAVAPPRVRGLKQRKNICYLNYFSVVPSLVRGD